MEGNLCYTGCDVEGHVGTDRAYYLRLMKKKRDAFSVSFFSLSFLLIVDLARTFPPECPDFTTHLPDFFYNKVFFLFFFLFFFSLKSIVG